jgi:zinc protease
MTRLILLTGLLIMTASLSPAHANDRVLNIESSTSPKGIEFWHVEDRNLPILTLHFAFKGAGAINDPDDKIGLGQLLSNTLDEGAGDRDAETFQETLDDHAIDLGFSNSRDHFSGKMRTLKRHAPLAFELLTDAIHKPLFEDEAVDRMRQANITRIKSSQSKPEWMASRLMNDIYFGDHAYARNSGGTISGLNAVTSDDLHGFVKAYFTKNNLVVSTAGDMNVDEAGLYIDQVFASLPDDEDLKAIENVTPPMQPLKKAFQKDSPQSVVQMVWTSFSKNDPDYHALRVMNHILGGGGFSSYLMEEVREKQGLTYGIYSQPAHLDHADYLIIQSATSPENIAPMTDSISSILTMMKNESVDADLLADAKSYLIGSLPMRFASTLSLSGATLRMQLDGRSIDALDIWADKINAVTADDIMRVSNRIFTSVEPSATVIAGAVPDDLGFEIIDQIPGIE